MDALILGAGYATRLYPLTKNRPKPLLPVGGIPILERICRQISEVDAIETIHVVTNHTFAGHYEAWMRDYERRGGLSPRLLLHDDGTSTPETRLGAIGDIGFVIDRAEIEGDLLVMAGDNLIESGLQDFVAFSREKGIR